MGTGGGEGAHGASPAFAEALVASWERRREDIERVAAPVRDWMLDALAPAAGETILEVGAGTGDTGFAALARADGAARLITSDVSAAMLDAARRRGAELDVQNVEYRVMDGSRLDLPDGSVDGVLCRFAYMLMPDPAAGLAEARRVLRPGGRLSLAVWGPPERNPFFTAAAGAMVRAGHLTPPDPGAPGIFALGDRDRTAALIEGAGFGGVRVEEILVQFVIPDIDEYLSVMADTAGPIALALRELSAEDRAEIADRCREALDPHRSEEGYIVPGIALGAAAR